MVAIQLMGSQTRHQLLAYFRDKRCSVGYYICKSRDARERYFHNERSFFVILRAVQGTGIYEYESFKYKL